MQEAAPEKPDALRVLHLTDPHLFASVGDELRGRATYATLARVLAHYRRSEWRANLVLATGDLVQDDSRGAYEHFCRLLSDLRLPLMCVPGNHDARSLMREALAQWSIPYCTAFGAGRWLIVGLDSCVDGAAGGRVSTAELKRLASALGSFDGDHALVALHHPPVAVGTPWLDEVGLQNGEEFLRLIEEDGKTKVALFGHVHQAVDVRRGGVRILGTPSTGRQFLPGSATFAVDDTPPAYRRLILHANGSVTTEVVPVP